jgi:GNAT superfamily N-acetyltransferase
VIPIRPARPGDRNYIIKSWVRSISGQFPFSRMSPTAINKYSKRVESLIDTAITVAACDPQNDDVVYGFACGESGAYLGVESPTLHYVWVRKPFRQRGIGTSLVRTIFPNGEPLIYTHITKAIHNANLEKAWNLSEYDPYYVEGALYSRARALDARAQGGGVTSACP